MKNNILLRDWRDTLNWQIALYWGKNWKDKSGRLEGMFGIIKLLRLPQEGESVLEIPYKGFIMII